MLEPIRQNDGANESERYLATLARSRFLSLWTYPSLSKSAGRLTQELADLTVVFGDDVLLFEDKDKGWPSHDDVHVAWARYFKRTIEDAAGQLWKAERYLRSRPTDIFLDAKGNESFPFELASSRTRYHLITVVGNSVEPARRYYDRFGQGSSGTFVFNASLSRDELEGAPFVVGDLDPKRTFVHVFDEETLDRLFVELGTISDFIHYLSEKEDAVREGPLRIAAGEEEILGFYFQERWSNGFGSLRFPSAVVSPDTYVQIPEGEWKEFQDSNAYPILLSQRRLAVGWNQLLERFSAGVVTANTGEANHVPIAVHEETLRACASENLFSRARLASNWEKKFSTVPRDARSARLVPSPSIPGRLYVFLFVPWVESSVGYEEYRQYRLGLMHAYATVLTLKVQGVREAIVIATEPKGNSRFRSETIIRVMYDSSLTPQESAAAMQIMQSEHILDTVSVFNMPVMEVVPMGIQTYGRNDACPCGSGNKNKKCCDVRGKIGRNIYGATLAPSRVETKEK